MKRIVVVDDQPVLASIYRAKFTAEGFQVAVAADGEVALEVIQRTHPDLVLLDLMLPKIKGVDVLKILRAKDAFKTLPILVFSSSAQPGLVEEAWAAGASMVLSKSNTSPKQVVESVISALAVKPSDDAKRDLRPPLTRQTERSRTGLEKRILLVEPNVEGRALLALVLQRGDFQVTHADGCAHALMLTEVAHFDLVMINQPACLEPLGRFCQQLRRRHSGLPVVMYSIRATPAETKRAMDEGVSEFISTAEQLLEAGAVAARLIRATAPSA
jgi:CheY-like chemotaxis protein